MAETWLNVLVLIIAILLLRTMWKPALILEYPYFIAGVFAVFIVPQAFSLVRFPGAVSDEAVSDTMLMSCLCLGSAVLGYRLSPSATLLRQAAGRVNSTRIFHVGLTFISCGFFFMYLLSRIQVNEAEMGGMTGTGTIYLFFAGLMFPGLAICLILLLERFTWPRMIATILGSINPILGVVIAGRREPAFIVGMTFLLGLFFTRRTAPPRLLILSALVFAMLAIPATGIYRGLSAQGELKKVKHINLVQNFKDFFNKESILELRNAAAVIQVSQTKGHYEYGAGYWNQLVFRFVPAQFVGRDFKDSLMIGRTTEQLIDRDTKFGHEFAIGTTLTGMGDSFRQFGWFGCLFFAALAVLFRTFWLAALQPNTLLAQLLYILICSSAMRAVTHQTVDFLPGFFYQFIFLKLGLWYAGERKTLPPPTTTHQTEPVSRGSKIPQERARYQGRLY